MSDVPGTSEHYGSRHVYEPTPKEMRADIIRLSWPCAVELFLNTMIGVITMMLVATLGKEAVSAIGITNQPLLIPNVVLQAFCVGGTALVARFLGQGDRDGAKRASEQTMGLSLLFSVVMAVVMYYLGGPLIKWMGATPDYYGMAELYMKYAAIGVFFQSMSTAVSNLFRGAGLTRLSMYFSLIANVINIVLGYVLINGLGPIPSLGILGACIAQLVGKIIGFVVAVYLLMRPGDLPIRPDLREIFRPHLDTITRICRIGTSSALEQVVMRVGIMAFTIYVIRLGTAEYAAHNIATSIQNYVVNIGQALGAGLVSVVGKNLGAGRPDIAEKYFSETLKISLVVSAAVMALLLIFPGPLARMFSNEADVIVNVVMALRVMAFFVLAQVVQIAVCGGLRGGGDTKWPLITTAFGVLGMRMVLGYLLIVVMGMGLFGAWLSWLCDQTIRAIIIYFRYRGGKWKQVRV